MPQFSTITVVSLHDAEKHNDCVKKRSKSKGLKVSIIELTNVIPGSSVHVSHLNLVLGHWRSTVIGGRLKKRDISKSKISNFIEETGNFLLKIKLEHYRPGDMIRYLPARRPQPSLVPNPWPLACRAEQKRFSVLEIINTLNSI